MSLDYWLFSGHTRGDRYDYVVNLGLYLAYWQNNRQKKGQILANFQVIFSLFFNHNVPEPSFLYNKAVRLRLSCPDSL